jgi:fibronectin-binding autotransporter adhesin
MKTRKSPLLSSIILNSLAADAPRPQGRSTSVLGGMAAMLFLATAPGAFAVTWTGTTSADWADGTNWGGTAPVADDPLTFAGTANAVTNNNIAADTSFGAISFTNTVNDQSFTLGGNRITLGGNITTTAIVAAAPNAITDTISLNMILSATRTITTSTRHNLTISGIISESSAGFGITKVGPATLNLTGANSFSGPVNVNGGVLTVNSIADTGTSALGTGPLTLTAGQFTFLGDPGSNTSTSRAITLAGGTTINATGTSAASSLTLAGTFTTGDGGAKTITFAGGNTGANTVSSLLANATDASVLTVVKNGGGTWALTNANNSFTGPLNLNQGTLIVSSINDSGVPSNIGQGVSFRMGNAASTGTLIYTGAAQSINRTVQIGNNAAPPVVGDTGGGMIQNDGAGLLTFNATPVFNTPLDTASGTGANRVLTLKGSNNGKITGIIQNNTNSGGGGTTTVGVTKAGAGTWTLEGANTYSGPMVVSEGTLTISGSRNVNAGTINVGGTAAVSSVLNLDNTGTYGTGQIVLGSNGATSSTINQSAGAITSVGGSGLIMGNNTAATNSTYALSGGSLTAVSIIMGTNGATTGTHVTNFSLSGTGALTATTLRIGRYDSAAAYNSDNTFTQTGGTATVTNLGLGGRALDTASTGPIVAKLVLTGGTFSATNFASLSAGGAAAPENGNTSTITIGGTAQVTLPAFPTVRGTNSTATLTFDGGTLIPAATSATYMSGLTNAFITANGAKIDVPTAKDITIAQALENAPSAVGSLTKSGVGTLILTGANTYTGDTTVVDGILDISSTYLADTSTLTIGTVAASPAVLNLPNAGTDTVASLVIDGVVQPNNLYDSSNSGGAITGLGKIQVGPASNTYANWLAANSPATGFSTDTDKDGVPNGVENVLGTNPNTSSAGLTQISATPTSVTYQHTLNPTIASDVSYSYQWSSDLTEWKASGVANTAGTIGTIVPSAPVSGVVTVTTTRSGTASSKLFTRIKAGNP